MNLRPKAEVCVQRSEGNYLLLVGTTTLIVFLLHRLPQICMYYICFFFLIIKLNYKLSLVKTPIILQNIYPTTINR